MNEQIPLVEMTDKERTMTYLIAMGFINIEDDLTWSTMSSALHVSRSDNQRLGQDLDFVFDLSGRLIQLR
jgi:hypothetical protein